MTTKRKEGPAEAALVWRRADLMIVLGVSSAQLSRLAATPDFPRAKALGLKGRGWIAEDVRKWLRELPDVEAETLTLEERAAREGRRPARELEGLNQ